MQIGAVSHGFPQRNSLIRLLTHIESKPVSLRRHVDAENIPRQFDDPAPVTASAITGVDCGTLRVEYFTTIARVSGRSYIGDTEPTRRAPRGRDAPGFKTLLV